MKKIKLLIILVLIGLLVIIYFDYQRFNVSKEEENLGTIEELLDVSFTNVFKVNVINQDEQKESISIEEFESLFKDKIFKTISEDKYVKNATLRYYAMNEENDFYFSVIPISENIYLLGKGYVGSLYSYDGLLYELVQV